MATLLDILRDRLRTAIAAALGDEHATADPILTATTNPQFGDFQANAAMGLAKKLGRKPHDLAKAIVEKIQWQGVLSEPPGVAGPGFINLKIDPALLSQQVATLAGDQRLGVAVASPPQRVVVDYSAPNVAKEMHIGHLRSTGIGDALARVLRFVGHEVIGQNHVGDWGTQFGMLIEHMTESGQADEHQITDLNAFYQAAKQRFDADADFADRARQRVVALQSGDENTLTLWRRLVEVSRHHFDRIYERLEIDTSYLEYRGESAYNDRLEPTVSALREAGQLRESNGALVVFADGFKNREGQPLGMIVKKTGGGFGYAATDLAAARYRLMELHADRVIYVTDSRQRDHFGQIFQIMRQTGWAPSPESPGGVRLEFVPFGTILGKDKKPFKTRSGETVKLADVLDEAEQRAFDLVTAKNASLPEDERRRIAHTIGIGALKYADLSNDRIKDYVFDWDRMLALEGNTAPYLQYSYARIQSIFRKAASDACDLSPGSIAIAQPAERALALKLLAFAAVVEAVADSLEPHRLCTYLYELAATFHQFYEQCPVLTAADDASRRSRLALCDLTARTLKQGLSLLGIGVPERM